MLNDSFSPSIYDDQMHQEECELSAFIRAVNAGLWRDGILVA
jgi:hypothetical protein